MKNKIKASLAMIIAAVFAFSTFSACAKKLDANNLADGSYTCSVTLSGGSGKAKIESPSKLTVKDGAVTATLVWSSRNYEYMMVGDLRYDPVQADGNSTFEIPITLDSDIRVSALTTAMSQPHLIEYTLHFDSKTLKAGK